MYTLLVTGDVPGAATYFNPLLQQTIIPCTSGTRPTAVQEGMTVYETDTNQYTKWNGSSWESVAGTRITYTPTLSATTTPPTMGTGNIRSGYYTILPGPAIHFQFFIKFGTSGSAAGSGTYTVSLPVNSASPFGSSAHSSLGAAMLADQSASSLRVGTVFVDGSDLTTVRFVTEGGVPTTSSAPWAWANGDYLSGSIIYPI